MSDAIDPFPIHVPQADLDDLADRLARVRWPDAGTVRDGSQGPRIDRIRALVERWQMFQPTSEEVQDATPEERRMLDDAERYQRDYSGYMRLQCTRPQSVAFALADSPVGLASWIYALFQDVSDSDGHPERAIPLDHLIDDVMLYWLPNAGPSSARFYWEAAQEMARGVPNAPVPLPAGLSMFPGEQVRLSRRWADERFADLRWFGEADRGGHFAAMENPRMFVEHVRSTFRALL